MKPKHSKEYTSYLASAQWKAKRKMVIARANGICEKCRQRVIQNIHHIHYDTLGYESLSDLLGVCRPCHRHIHGLDKPKPKKRYRKNSKRKARNELRLKALKLGVPLDVLKPFKRQPPPPPANTKWDFKERLLEQFKTR